MKYDFSKQVSRLGSGSYKWDADLPQGVHLTREERERVIPLWVADMDFVAPPFIREALQRRLDHGVFGYALVQVSYYEAVQGWFRLRHGLEIPREWIQYTTGVVPALSAVIKALTRPGDGVILSTPVFNFFFSSIRNNGCELVDVPLLREDLSDGRLSYRLDFEGLERACQAAPGHRVLLLCNPHNPAGRVWTEEELSRIAEIASRYGVPVISDEIHCELTAPGTRYFPYALCAGAGDGWVMLSSPSKGFNTAGLQIANIFCPRADWRERIDRAININEVCDVNPFGPVALEAAYSPEGAQWLDELCELIWSHYNLLLTRFREELPDLRVSALEGTYLPWVDITPLGISSQEVEAALLQREQVWVNAGSLYGGEGYIRINLACPTARFAEGLERIIRGLKALQRR